MLTLPACLPHVCFVLRNVKMLKGEADVLITDPHGIVQAILEIKTASGWGGGVACCIRKGRSQDAQWCSLMAWCFILQTSCSCGRRSAHVTM
jgi:hypothetical protein